VLCEELQELCEFLPVKLAVLVEVELLEDAEEDRCISVLKSNQLETNHPERKSRAGFIGKLGEAKEKKGLDSLALSWMKVSLQVNLGCALINNGKKHSGSNCQNGFNIELWVPQVKGILERFAKCCSKADK
jgi:hypothetical protein